MTIEEAKDHIRAIWREKEKRTTDEIRALKMAFVLISRDQKHGNMIDREEAIKNVEQIASEYARSYKQKVLCKMITDMLENMEAR